MSTLRSINRIRTEGQVIVCYDDIIGMVSGWIHRTEGLVSHVAPMEDIGTGCPRRTRTCAVAAIVRDGGRSLLIEIGNYLKK